MFGTKLRNNFGVKNGLVSWNVVTFRLSYNNVVEMYLYVCCEYSNGTIVCDVANGLSSFVSKCHKTYNGCLNILQI